MYLKMRFRLSVVMCLLLAACGGATTALTTQPSQGTAIVTPRIVIPTSSESQECQGRAPETISQGATGYVLLDHCAGSPCGVQASLIDGAIIEATRDGYRASTRSVCGRYTLSLPKGNYLMTAAGGRAIGYGRSGPITCRSQKIEVGRSTTASSFECRL